MHFSAGKCIFREEIAFFCRKVHFFYRKTFFSAVYSGGLRIMNGSLFPDETEPPFCGAPKKLVRIGFHGRSSEGFEEGVLSKGIFSQILKAILQRFKEQ